MSTKSPKQLTVRDVVDRIGRDDICKHLGATKQGITNHIAAGTLPASWFPGMRDLAKARGFRIPERLFAWKRLKRTGAGGDGVHK